MNKEAEEKEFGELFDESFDFKHITWKISYALTLPDLVDYEVRSPTFSFAGATWKLAIFPNGQTKYSTEGHIDIHMVRLNSRFPEHEIFFKMCFLTKYGKEFESYSSCLRVNSERYSVGVGRYQKKSIFISKKNILAPKEVLSIVCQMRTKKIDVIDSSHTESAASLLESSIQTSTEEPESPAVTVKGLPGEKMVHDFKELFLKQEDCDVVIKVKGKEFQAHKTILRARSPVFASTFRNDMKEKATGVIDIEDCDPFSFSDFLCFLYCGNVENLTAENAFSLFIVADKYDVQDLRSECLEFMKKNLSVDTFCETVTLALQYFEKELINMTTNFFAKHLQDIIVTVKWQTFLVENPIQGNEIMVKALVSNKK